MRLSRRPSVSDIVRSAAQRGRELDSSQQRAAAALAAARPGRGVYLWGPPGSGKTTLLDCWAATLPAEFGAQRWHFHTFFAALQRSLAEHRAVAPALAALLGDCQVLCFDEFHVHDRADGIYLRELLAYTQRRGITVVMTSNYAPQTLMPNPLVHREFEPTIAELCRQCAVVAVDGGVDYRTQGQTSGSVTGFAAGSWVVGSPPRAVGAARVLVGSSQHPVRALEAAAPRVWFTFADLCDTPTAPSDYLALAREYAQWTVSGIPAAAARDALQRFANVVDVLCDNDIRTEFYAEVPIVDFVGAPHDDPLGTGPLDVSRTRSRLLSLREAVKSDGSAAYGGRVGASELMKVRDDQPRVR